MLILPVDTIDATHSGDITVGLNESDQQWLTVQFSDNTTLACVVAFKVSLDGVNFVAIEGYEPDDPSTAVESMTDAAVTGIVRFDCTGYKAFLFDLTYTSGSVKIVASLATPK